VRSDQQRLLKTPSPLQAPAAAELDDRYNHGYNGLWRNTFFQKRAAYGACVIRGEGQD